MIVLLPIVRSIPLGLFYQDIANGIQDALQELGHTVQWFPLGEIGVLSAAEAETAVRWARAGKGKLVLDLCCWGHALSQARLDSEENAARIYDVGGVSCVAMLLDQAYFQPIASIHARRLYAAFPAPSVLEQLGMIEPSLPLAGSVFSPPGVRPQNDRSTPWSERDIDVLYTGNLQVGALSREWHPQADHELCDALADAASGDVPLHRTAIDIAHSLGRSPDAGQWCALLRGVEFFLRAKNRVAVVRAAAQSGVQIHVVGGGWDKIELPANVTVLPLMRYAGMLELAGRARLCIDSSSYPDGANDRIFNYALNGTPCLTNSRNWVESHFGPGQGMHFYLGAETQTLSERIPELLSQPEQLRLQGETARAITLAGHTWRHRVEDILALLDPA